MDKHILARAHWKEIRERQIDLAVLPWGATEAHNFHLPYGTDIYETEAIAWEAARISGKKGGEIIVLPAVPFGVNTGQADIKLDINMNPSTQLILLRDIIASLQRQGINRLLVLNGHGGNEFKPVLRELGLEFPDMLLTLINWYKILDHGKYFENSGDHADEMETSLMLYLHPELVLPRGDWGSGAARRPVLESMRDGTVWMERKWSQVTEDTGIGDPSQASREKGEKYFSALTDKIALAILELSQADPLNMYIDD